MKAVFWGAAVAAATFAGVAQADIDLNTGTDANGTVLAAGTLDPFWTISTNGVDFTAARVVYPGDFGGSSNLGQTCCGMDTVPDTAAWVSTPGVIATNPATSWGFGNMVYARRTFDLSGYDLDTVSLTGNFRVADAGRGIYINGNYVPGTDLGGTYTFSFNTAFSADGPFVDGINTIEIRGTSVNSQWDAFWLETHVEGTMAPIPEPGTWALLGAGLGLLALCQPRTRARS